MRKMSERKVYTDTREVLDAIIAQVGDIKGKLLVIGCSTSEVAGEKIGSSGNLDLALEMADAFFDYADKYSFDLAFQCCEHLNRALVVDQSLKERKNLTEVNAIPVKRAGGAMAEEAYKRFPKPCLVESLEADLGLDIGLTLIGMNLKKVAVPVRLEQKKIGQARIVFARTRAKYVGGERAIYNSSLK